MTLSSMVVATMDKREQHRRIVITAIVIAAIALGFYIAAFVRFW
jgi:hypothetical protein